MTFYGTGGADAVPNPFCRCLTCENARSVGGMERRRRSMLRVNEKLCFDLGPDSVAQAMDFGDYYGLEHVLVTHTHEDHFYYAMAETRALASQPSEKPLNYYLTDKAYDILELYHGSKAIMKGSLSRFENSGVVAFHRLEFNRPANICGMEVIPFKGNHTGNMDEYAANYLVGLPDGRTLYYAVDTGYYLPETFEALKRHKIDILISECTNGDSTTRGEKPDFHLDFASCLRVFGRLLDDGVINKDTKIYLTHINHKHTATHADMVKLVGSAGFPCEITVAYDGYRIP